MSRSIPFSEVFDRIFTIEGIDIEGLANKGPHAAFYPPIERNTFLPSACHCSTSAQGKLAVSMITDPFVAMFAKAKIMSDALALVSSVLDCPQNADENPQ
jgi:hypothetical protein